MKIVNYKDLETNGDIEYFRCGSLNLFKFLVSNECVPINMYTSYSSGKKRNIWVFIKSDKVKDLLVLWSKNKPIGGDCCE